MSTTQIAVTTVIVATLVVFTTLGITRMAEAHGEKSDFFSGYMRHSHFMGHDWSDSDKVEQYADMCQKRGEEKIVEFVSHIEEHGEFTSDQQTKWQALAAAVVAEKETIAFVCQKVFNAENHANTIARLELAESLMATGQESLKKLSPYIKEFYLSLDEQQQQGFDEMVRRHHDRRFF